jgi:hypothetical protein
MALRISTETKLGPEEAIERAVGYFGTELGLTVDYRLANLVRLVGGGGHVLVSVKATPKGSEVEIETMEWEPPVRRFVGDLPR